VSGKTFKCDFHPIRAKFFGALNSILSQIGTKSEQNVSLSLLAAECHQQTFYSITMIAVLLKCCVLNTTFIRENQKVIQQI